MTFLHSLFAALGLFAARLFQSLPKALLDAVAPEDVFIETLKSDPDYLILLIAAGVLLIAAAVTVFLIIRKKRKK